MSSWLRKECAYVHVCVCFCVKPRGFAQHGVLKLCLCAKVLQVSGPFCVSVHVHTDRGMEIKSGDSPPVAPPPPHLLEAFVIGSFAYRAKKGTDRAR